MKIMLNCLSHAWGGRETCFFDDITELSKAGHDTIGIVFKNSEISKKLKENYPDVTLEEIDGLFFKYFNPALMLRYYKIVKKHQPDVVHSHDIWTLYTLLIIMRFFPKIPLISTEHLFIGHKKTGLYRKLLYKRLTTMIAISDAMIPNVLEMYPLENSQVKSIYGGFAYKDATPENDEKLTREYLQIPSDAFIAGMIGRIDPAKGQLELVEATDILALKYPDKKIYLLIAGRPTLNKPESIRYKEQLDELISNTKVKDNIKILGFVNSVPEFLDLLDVFVMPSLYEAFGLVLIQAMSRSLPVIATDAGSAREIIDVEENGYVYPPKDSSKLAVCLENVMNSNNIEDMRKASLEKFDKVFDYRHHLKNITAFYEQKVKELT